MLALALGAGAIVYWRAESVDSSRPTIAETAAVPVTDASAPAKDTGASEAPADPPDDSPELSTVPDQTGAPKSFRASVVQREQDVQRMANEDDWASLAQEFEERAARGDIDAAANLREMLQECMIESGTPDQIAAGVEWFAQELQLAAGEVQVFLEVYDRTIRRCEGWLAGTTFEQRQARWQAATERAAATGDALARLALPPQDEAWRRAAIEFLRQATPHDLILHGATLGILNGLDYYAYVRVGCQLIEACAGDPIGYALSPEAQGLGLAAMAGLRTIARTGSQRQQLIDEARTRWIIEQLEAQRWEELLPPPTPPGARRP